MKLVALVNNYVALKRSLGMRFATQPRVFRWSLFVEFSETSMSLRSPRKQSELFSMATRPSRTLGFLTIGCSMDCFHSQLAVELSETCLCQTLHLHLCRPFDRTFIPTTNSQVCYTQLVF